MRVRRLTRDSALTFAVWATAAAVYIVVGVFVTDFLLSVLICLGYLLVAVWLVPAAIRRLL